VLGWCPMATNSASIGCSVIAPVLWFLTLTAVTLRGDSAPSTSTTSESHRKWIFGFLNARSCMIFEARSVSRRWTTVTSAHRRVR